MWETATQGGGFGTWGDCGVLPNKRRRFPVSRNRVTPAVSTVLFVGIEFTAVGPANRRRCGAVGNTGLISDTFWTLQQSWLGYLEVLVQKRPHEKKIYPIQNLVDPIFLKEEANPEE